jgi:hypothetical protein
MYMLIKKSPFRLASNLGLILVLLITGCNLPGKSESPTRQSAEATEPASPIPTPTPVEPVQSRSLDQALYDGVENGTWTVEESILTGLRFLAGEVSSDEAFGDTPLMSTEGTGVIYTAQRYIIEGTDESAKVEIQRYLDMLMPSSEVLEQISRPAQQSNATAHLARGVSPQDRVNCQEHWRNSFLTPVPAPVTCLLSVERNARGTNIRLYYPEYWGTTDPRVNSVATIMEAATKSAEKYNGYGPDPIATVYIVITDLNLYLEGSYRPDVYAAAYNHSFALQPPQCRIGVFPPILEEDPGNLQQIIAHEMFHCYEHTNLRPQFFEVHHTYRKWWSEGAAEYFSGVVYPSNNFEFRFNDDFRNNANYIGLLSMEYETNLFFQFLAREGGLGPEGVISNVLARMPQVDGSEHQRDALASVDGMGDLFHNFARAYADKRLTDMGGSTIDIDPSIEDVRFYGEGTQQEVFQPPSFFLGLYYVNFADQTKFSNTVLVEGENGKHAMRPREFVGAWQPVPPRINTVCDPKEYIYVGTETGITGSTGYEVTFSSTGVHQESLVCDECLFGSWELDNDSDYYYMHTLVGTIMDMLPMYGLDTSGGDAWLANVSGQMLIKFSEDGIAVGSQSDYSWAVNGIDYDHPRRIITMTSTFNGGGSANYIIREQPEEEKWIYFNNGVFDIMNTVKMMDMLVATVPTGGSNTTIFLSSPVRYECSDATLLYTTMPEIGTLIFHRMPPPSP